MVDSGERRSCETTSGHTLLELWGASNHHIFNPDISKLHFPVSCAVWTAPVLSRRRISCQIALERALQIDSSRENSQGNPIFACPPSICPHLGPPETVMPAMTEAALPQSKRGLIWAEFCKSFLSSYWLGCGKGVVNQNVRGGVWGTYNHLVCRQGALLRVLFGF